MDKGRQTESPGLEYCLNSLEHDVAEEPDELIALMQRMAKTATNALKMRGKRMSLRQLDRWRPALVIYRVHQGSVFRAHVHWLYRDASALEDPLRPQQEPRARCIESIEGTTVDLDVVRA
jgi:hypothetical protein